MLSDDGVRNRLGEDFDETEAQHILDGILIRLDSALKNEAAHVPADTI
ncbi:hypothetical protein [Streptomyces sp. NPDC001435]